MKCKDGDHWRRLQGNRGKVKDIRWMKVHPKEREAFEKGFSQGDWNGNRVVNLLAHEGTRKHCHDESEIKQTDNSGSGGKGSGAFGQDLR